MQGQIWQNFDTWEDDHWHRKDDRANQITNKYGKIRMTNIEDEGNNGKPSKEAKELKGNGYQ